MRALAGFGIGLILAVSVGGSVCAQATGGAAALLASLKRDGLEHGQALKTETELSDSFGPRLTWSPGFERAQTWIAGKLSALGLTNVHLENIDYDGLAWEKKLVWLELKSPDDMMLVVQPAPWSPPSNGLEAADAVLFTPKTIADLAQYEGRLAGKVVLFGAPRPIPLSIAPLAQRLIDPQAIAQRVASMHDYYVHRDEHLKMFDTSFSVAVADFLRREGPRLVVTPSGTMANGGESGIIYGGSPAFHPQGPGWEMAGLNPFPVLLAIPEHYNRLARLAQAGAPLHLQWRIDANILGQRSAHNLIGEIVGSDPAVRDEYVMASAHLDSWSGATGATDDGAGVAILMEAARLLKVSGFAPRRTIRFAFFAGEEEGLRGAQGYANRHLGTVHTDPAQAFIPIPSWRRTAGPIAQKPEWSKFDAIINIDDGGGRARGLFAGPGNPQLTTLLNDWIKPMADLGVIQAFDESDAPADQAVFQQLQLPAISFLQDPLDYGTRTHHTNVDTPDHLIEADLNQNAVVLAYLLAKLADDPNLAPRPAAAGH